MKFYNTMTRKVEEFKPINKGFVGLYTCGPTVYNYAHIGNLRTYVFEDVLKRWLKYRGYKVKHVMNITDVGHLTSDADEGEDKMIKGAKREGKTVYEIAEFYTNAFKRDMKLLNLLEPDVWCKATEHINDMINLIKILERKKYTYVSGGNVYFDTSKFKNYGKLAKLKLSSLKHGARTSIDKNKKNPQDFVLWFTSSKFKNQVMQWDSPWGKGYPGWHIECSAMSIKYLGKSFDIHCGGIDHISVHHTNEIAQSEAAIGKKWVNFWMHCNFLIIDSGAKMAKSGDGFLTLEKVMELSGVNANAVRYFLMSAHYRQELRFNLKLLVPAQKTVDKLNFFVQEMLNITKKSETDKSNRISKSVKQTVDYALQGFENAMDNDLNVPLALPYIFEMLNKLNSKKDRLTNKDAKNILKMLKKINNVLAVMSFEKQIIPESIKKLMEQRNKARKNKDWQTSDKLREQIQKQGYRVHDEKDGSYLSKVM